MAGATDKEKEIHQLILSKDDLAFARFCDEYYELIYEKVLAFNKTIFNANETLITDVVTDTFLNYFNTPQRYHPDKQSLEKFLIMDAEGDLKNEWAKLKLKNKKFAGSVELEEENGNSIKDEELNPVDHLINKENTEILDGRLKELFKDEKDVQIAHLMLCRERRTLEYAKILMIHNLDEEVQRKEVKKVKDRIEKVIQRKLRNNE